MILRKGSEIVDYKLDQLEPKAVFHFFEAINQIPRESGHEKELSDYMVAFANERQLKVYQDDMHNVVIWKPGTKGYENSPVTILQGHLDMVCEQNEGTDHDFQKDPIDMFVDGEWLTANGTTLGADNGIALAFSLALLDANQYEHPPLEVIFTTDEEVGLTGAQSLDKSILTGQYFINLDSEEEGELTVGCAGGLKAGIYIPIAYTTHIFDKPVVKRLDIKNLKGGHSGVDIAKNRENADRLLGRILGHLRDEISLRLVDIRGGSKDNVIPREAYATVIIEEAQIAAFNDRLKDVVTKIKNETKTSDPNITVTEKTSSYDDALEIMSKQTTDDVIFTLINAPNGIQTMSSDLEDIVESSLNVGKCAKEGNEVVFLFAVRSSVNSLKYHITNQLEWFARRIGAKFVETANYPEWPFKPDSNLLRQAASIYENMFNEKALVKAIHAGLEPGAFLEKMPHLDAISFGPDMEEVHSPNERLHIESTKRTWEFLVEVLKALK